MSPFKSMPQQMADLIARVDRTERERDRLAARVDNLRAALERMGEVVADQALAADDRAAANPNKESHDV